MDKKELSAAIEFASEHYEPGTLPHATAVAAIISRLQIADALADNTAALNRETAAINEAIDNPKAHVQVDAKQPDDAPTAQELQDICLAKVRSDRSLKPKIKTLIGEYGAKTINDLTDSQRKEIKPKLEAI